VGRAAQRRPRGGPADARPPRGRAGPDRRLRAVASGGPACLRPPGRTGPGAPRPRCDPCRASRRPRAGLLVGADGGGPVHRQPFLAQIPANRATWDAEWTRLAGSSDPGAWHTAAKTWESLGYPHRAGYAWWRHAEVQLDAGQPAAAAAAPLRAAVTAADGHAPLLAEIRKLAERARIPLQAPSAASAVPGPAEAPAPYGLTGPELAVLDLLAAGRTNAQIGAELYISPKTAGVHVTSILRKLGVTNRVQAAALAERAGLLHTQQP
jgi:DNA-binding CsgD family transcriptional regulator